MAIEGSVVGPEAGSQSGREDTREVERARVERACQGDAEAFRAIVQRHYHGLFGLCLRMVGNRHDAEDLLQQTFSKAYVKLSSYDPAYRLSTWLYRIALNTCRDHLKSRRRCERPSAEIPEAPPEGPIEHPAIEVLTQGERVRELRAAIEKLRPSYREIIVLKDIEERSYREIQEVTGVPITALKIRAIRARARLRELLEPAA